MRFSIRAAILSPLTALLAGAPVIAYAQKPAHDSTQHQHRPAGLSDSAYKALQSRGRIAMGVDQYTSIHVFDDLPDGGRIELQRGEDDRAGVATIRSHLRDIKSAFETGNFSTPAFVHMTEVPGTAVMARRRAHIRYAVRDLPRGAELRVRTTDPEALTAVHQFLAFQRGDHRAAGAELGKKP